MQVPVAMLPSPPETAYSPSSLYSQVMERLPGRRKVGILNSLLSFLA